MITLFIKDAVEIGTAVDPKGRLLVRESSSGTTYLELEGLCNSAISEIEDEDIRNMIRMLVSMLGR